MTVKIIPINDKLETAQAFFKLINDNRDHLSQWLNWLDFNTSVADSQKFLTDSVSNIAKGSELNYFIMVNNTLAGTITLREIVRGSIKNKPEKIGGIIGYWLAKDYTSKGVTTNALDQLIKEVKNRNSEDRFIDTLILKAHPENIGSNRVAIKNGFTFQYIDPKAESLHGQLNDLNVYHLDVL